MTRIATLAQSQLLLRDVLRNEARTFDDQRQIATGFKSKDYKGMAIDVTTLSGAKTLKANAESFLHDNTEVQRRLELYNLTLGSLHDLAQGLRNDVLSAINGNTGIALRQKIDDYFKSAASLLNTRDNGRYIFSGSRTDASPIVAGAQTPAGLAALTNDLTTTPTDFFQNNAVTQSARIDQALTLGFGVMASDVGDEFMESLRRLMRFDDGTQNFGFGTSGPISAPMTDDQRNFLTGELARLNSAMEDTNEAQALNGVHQRTLDDVQVRLGNDVTFITTFISDIQDADIPTAVANLQRDQLALEASFRTIGQLSGTSLLDYI